MLRGLEAIRESGIVPHHEPIIMHAARTYRSVIMVRPVNKLSTSLIEEGFATKDLHVKSKSSDWGIQAGFICCDQKYSKLKKKPADIIEQYNGETAKSLNGNYARSVPLVVSKQRIDLLVKQKKIHRCYSKNDVIHCTSHGAPHTDFELVPHYKMINGERSKFYRKNLRAINSLFHYLPHLRSGYWVFTKDEQPLQVLADYKSFVPLTADYDLFCTSPHLSNYHTGDRSFRGVIYTVKKSLGQRERRNVSADLGRIQNVTNSIKNEINGRVGKLKVIHHGVELDNPATELDYPITAFTPWGEILAVQCQSELEALIRDITKCGYIFYSNRLWTQRGAINSNPKDTDLKDYNFNQNFDVTKQFNLEVIQQNFK